ncbi:E3 ubiquitin-protein isoform 2 [Schistosoma japonicum]|uniref:E3 ubiquitin-protein isoform 2 n=2 Tax=Schistosoma japonicum TaxID=6182 RepID=A0A4Z2DYD0_SCHJA|nr:E3 ubiquitin-protein isoform 2 [Schistosoma japonicum]
MMSATVESVGKQCSVCHEDIDYFAYGSCNHPTCTKCVLKLRKFGSADEPEFSKCPTCRQNINRVVIMRTFVPFDNIDVSVLRHDPRFDFMFPDKEIEQHYSNMLKSTCPVCGEEKKSLSALNRHTTSEHQLSYCDLCIRYARLLPCEFVLMKPLDLTKHRSWDKNKKKGHPLCDFCQERFYELEDLIIHIRDIHFLCDLCMTTGKFVVFRQQCELLDHYGDSHHLCSECRAQQRISCFATADRLGLHRFQEHPNEVANDPDSWLPISIRHVTTTDSAFRRRDQIFPDVYSVGGVLAGSDGRLISEDNTNLTYRRPNPSEWTGEDFPSLQSTRSGVVSSHLTTDESNSPQTAAQSPKELTSASTERKGETTNNVQNKRPTVGGSWVSRVSNVNFTNKDRLTSEDFPSLTQSPNPSTGNPPTWVRSGASQSIQNPQTSNHAFPALRSNTSTSVASSIPSSGWPTTDRNSTSEQLNSPSLQSLSLQTPTSSDFPSLPTNSNFNRPKPVIKALENKSTISKTTSSLLDIKKKKAESSLTTTGVKNPKKLKPKQDIGSKNCGLDESGGMTLRDESEKYLDDQPLERPQFTHIKTVDVLSANPVTHSNLPNNCEQLPSFTNDFPSLSGSSHDDDVALKKSQKRSSKKKVVEKPPNQSSEQHCPNTTSLNNPLKPEITSLIQLIKSIQFNDNMDIECLLYAKSQYIPPPDMETRNRELIHTVENDLFDKSKTAFIRFADLSRRYRYKQINATAYLEGLVGLLSSGTINQGDNDKDENIPYWIAPMISLLPDIGLQRALLRALQAQGSPRIPLDMQEALLRSGHQFKRNKNPILNQPPWAKKVLKTMQTCQECGQVCLRSDLLIHMELAHSVI